MENNSMRPQSRKVTTSGVSASINEVPVPVSVPFGDERSRFHSMSWTEAQLKDKQVELMKKINCLVAKNVSKDKFTQLKDEIKRLKECARNQQHATASVLTNEGLGEDEEDH